MSFTTYFNCKQCEKHDFLTLLTTQSNYRHKNDKRGVWNRDVLGGFFQEINKLEEMFIRDSRVVYNKILSEESQ